MLLCMAVLFCGSALQGCGNTKLVFTTGIAADDLFRIGNVRCKFSEAVVYLNNQKNQYENIYGIEMWNHDFGDMTLETYLKNQVVSQLAQVKSMVLLAEEEEITLSEEEIQKASEAAETYFSSLSEKEVELLQTNQELIQKMYEDYCLAYKAYEQITEDVSVEISDDEARIIRVQQILVPDARQANEMKEKLDAGEDFEALASNYSKAPRMVEELARGDKSKAYEEVAFELDNEEISDVFETEEGYYILKCLETYVEEASEENKRKVAQEQKTERFQEIYSNLMKDTLSEFQEKMWEKVTFADYEEVESSSFFEVYEEYF